MANTDSKPRRGPLASGRLALILGPVIIAVAIPILALSQAGDIASAAPGDPIHDSAVEFVSERVIAPHDSVNVMVELPTFPVDRDEIADFSFQLLSSKPVVGTVPFRASLILRDGSELAFAATARVRIYDTVAVTARRLGRHETVEAGDIRFERREVTLLRDGYFTAPREVTGKRTRRIITAGALVRASDVESVPLIERGSNVTVSVVIGPVTVTSTAKALEDGHMGETIRVRDHMTGKRLTCVVAGKRLVLLERAML
jgi:flagella basal body P-ring formation protein FlgA